MIKASKATTGQVKRHNRELLLRAVYTGLAGNRAALALETGLTKPAVGDLIAELIDEGFLIEEGFGESTESGGKRPRLLKFVADARQVIGVAINEDCVLGVLTNLDGKIIAEHYIDIPEHIHGDDLLAAMTEVINGLMAQLHAPLLCIGIGVLAVVDDEEGVVRYAPRFGWRDFPLGERLVRDYNVPAYVSNSTELAALAQYAFSGDLKHIDGLATVLVEDSVGVGLVLGGATYHTGSELGTLMFSRAAEPGDAPLETLIRWLAVKERALELGYNCKSAYLSQPDLTYLHIRRAASQGDEAALALEEELSTYLAQIFAWIIALVRPHHISLAGTIADLGDTFLTLTVQKTEQLVLPDLVRATHFSLDTTSNLVALGATAKSVQVELGLV
jgi:predicted NBD/HSP70 family sugar kinase